MMLRSRTMTMLGACCSLAACLIAGCAEEGNDEFFQRTAPPGVNGPPQSYTAGSAGQAPPGGSGGGAAAPAEPAGEAASEAPAPAPPEAPAAPAAPAPIEESKG
jgi:hypothetical protein